MKCEIIREIDRHGPAKQCLVKRDDGKYFVVSSVTAFDTGKPETLAFACDEYGEWESGHAHAGGIGKTRSQTIAQLESGEGSEGNAEEWADECGGPLGAIVTLIGAIGSGRTSSAPPDELVDT